MRYANRSDENVATFPREKDRGAFRPVSGIWRTAGVSGVEDADEREFTVFFSEIESVAHDKKVRYDEPGIVGLAWHGPGGWFVEKGADPEESRPEFQQLLPDGRKGQAGVENVFDQQDLRSVDVNVMGDHHVAGGGPVFSIARRPQELDPAGKGEASYQVGRKHERAFQDAYHDKLAFGVELFRDPLRKFVDPFTDPFGGDEFCDRFCGHELRGSLRVMPGSSYSLAKLPFFWCRGKRGGLSILPISGMVPSMPVFAGT